MIDDKKLQQIIEHYGVVHQERKAVEEMSELIKELAKKWNCKDRSEVMTIYANALEEIADVYIMIRQLMLMYDQSAILQIAEHKVDRTIRRMNAHE
jgi:hypothetical protein